MASSHAATSAGQAKAYRKKQKKYVSNTAMDHCDTALDFFSRIKMSRGTKKHMVKRKIRPTQKGRKGGVAGVLLLNI